MPTPAILSAQMEPPPVQPVVELNMLTGEYYLNGGPNWGGTSTTLDAMLRNASGPDPSTLLVPGKGIPLHDDTSQSGSGIWPPSIRATAEMIALIQPLIDGGGLTSVYQFTNEYYYNQHNDSPNFYIFGYDPFDPGFAGPEFPEVYQASWEVFTNPPGYLFEGYAYGHPTTGFNGYVGGSPTALSSRRQRAAGTWGFDRGDAAGVNRYRSGQSANGSPQWVNVTGGRTPYDVDYNLSYFGPIHSIHFGAVGVDTATQEGIDNGWNWWPEPGYWLEYVAFYRVRPIGVLAPLSRPDYQRLRVSQMYAEIIHDPVV